MVVLHHQTQHTMSVEVDWNAISSQLIGGAITGLNATIRFTRDRAMKHAPVRAIFPRGRRGKEFSGGFGRGAAGAAGYEQWKRSRAKNHRIDVPQNNFSESGPRYGQNNSFIPVMRYMDLRGTTVVTGDMRRYNPSDRMMSAHVGGFEKVGRRGPATELEIDPNQYLSGRGRLEAKTGRAKYREVTKSHLMVNRNTGKIVRVADRERDFYRLGGKLRGEIFAVPARRQGNFLWGYVISPVSYSAPQEFGTRHNRSHPYMRPSLYESRTELRTQVTRAVRRSGDRSRKGSGERIGGIIDPFRTGNY